MQKKNYWGDGFIQRSAQKLKPVTRRNKRAGRVNGGRGGPVAKTELLLLMFNLSGSHFFPAFISFTPAFLHAALSPAPAPVLLSSAGQACSPQQHCGFARFRAERGWSISSPVWLKESRWVNMVLLMQRRVAKEWGGRGQKQETPL